MDLENPACSWRGAQPAGASADGPRLLADIGATHARFAWQAGAGAALAAEAVLLSANYPTLESAVRDYLERIDRAGLQRPRAAAIAVAAPVTGERVALTNLSWEFSVAGLRDALALQRLELLNDFTALALALPGLGPADLRRVGGSRPDPAAAIALLGPGSGLGVSGLLPDGRGGWLPLQGEGGHVSLAAATPREQLVVDALARRHGHASAERALSGAGLVSIREALAEADGAAAGAWSAERISAAALAGSDARCEEALAVFCALLGSVAGNLALTLGARGGVYIGGGIVPRLGDWLDRSPFRARFDAKGRMRAYLEPIPVWVITARRSPALAGAARALDADQI